MNYYTIEEFCISDGWINTWRWEDNNGGVIPMVYDSKKDAKEALNEFFKECHDDFINGDIKDQPNKNTFRIVRKKCLKLL